MDVVFERFLASVPGQSWCARSIPTASDLPGGRGRRGGRAAQPRREPGQRGARDHRRRSPWRSLIPFDIPFVPFPPRAKCVMAAVLVDVSVRVRGLEGGGNRFSVRRSSSRVWQREGRMLSEKSLASHVSLSSAVAQLEIRLV